jgi:capsular polysaccharide biosynthesis protein
MSDMGSGAERAELQGGAWLRPATDENDLRRYLTTLRERRMLILVCVVIATLVALAYVEVSTPVYQAQAGLLIVPANVSGDVTLTGLPLIQSSSDPTRDVETASELVTTTDVAAGVKSALRLPGTPRQILSKVTAIPVAQSNVVAVTATGGNPTAAARLANGFVNGVITQRTALFQTEVDAQIALLKREIATATPNVVGRLAAAVSELQTLRSAPLPDMRVSTLAQPPTAPTSPKKTLSVAVGIVGGLLIGIVAAFALEGLDPRLRREDQLRRLFALPVLARIPREGAGGGLTRAVARACPVVAGPALPPAQPLVSESGGVGGLSDTEGDPAGVAPDPTAFDPGDRRGPVGGEDDYGDQPRRLARLVRRERDPDRGRPAPSVYRCRPPRGGEAGRVARPQRPCESRAGARAA